MTALRSRPLLVAAAAAAILLSACGGDADEPVDDAGMALADDAASQDTTEDVGSEDTSDTDPATADPAEGVADDDEEERDEGGLAAHRAPAEARALADCDAVTESPPGAIIVFPSDQGDGWLDAGPGPVTVEVIGCSDTFEANLQYEAFHGENSSPTLNGFTQGGTLGTWGEFSFEETYWTPGEWTVVVFDDDAESGARVEFDEVTFTVE